MQENPFAKSSNVLRITPPPRKYSHQTSFHSLVLRNEETFVIECETWQVNAVMATVNLDYVALSSALPACVCV